MVSCAVTVGIQMKRIKQTLSCLLALLLILSAVACTGKTNDPADTGASESLTVPGDSGTDAPGTDSRFPVVMDGKAVPIV